ncbi:uncharacterized protein A1O9_12880 [Exophiala aquamarina CBS 119918]|uniref:Xylanolytic transcriptional activator regulatory domain-containing protein n=1 Tax=Exophiala aquamarina CBS 119918 TaxID=1182545 RepID=A0A072NT56_9EURO|nr:uncharacterized protein A1O9_12880 [Exophiala aquamarina CBS 119918]KEF51064.1 hypothetical protein A1O9_12880 [Exophiala aquamarina CBS 119918]
MRLITQIPPEFTKDPGFGNQDLALYRSVKQLLLLSEVECKPSLYLVQALLLISSYEIGHGLESAAYLSIGTCARLAILLGLHRRSAEPADLVSTEEASRTWWGIVIVESFYLPLDDDAWDDEVCQKLASSQPVLTMLSDKEAVSTESNPSLTPISMTTSSDVQAGPFAREAQAATLLGRTFTHITTPTSDAEFNMAECQQLDRTLTSFLTVLPAEDLLKPCTAYCGAMGICIRSVMIAFNNVFHYNGIETELFAAS